VLNCSKEYQYDFEVQVTDNLQTNSLTWVLDVGQPIFMISSKQENFVNMNGKAK